ncbi:thymidine phosphorylase [Colwellia psychrerythraea]|uniref:Thymidine phosphorylase n=1 Tax=Colwellia psychrerythraea (strain 34H / ATCC BAA-681) TaxID=167879 RepID=TYPH_COLP3|nr:thymidine phosphorylase [Colwellia psychrerythraea]Q483R6.1 RecName: Full=Thymidine phosphorylase; AltName: Full=TdRPase [Colwellia psychrerythraea 34H]AAZ26339.1 thymidine phosphorylase [Colwellia psychrerythraea 34H]
MSVTAKIIPQEIIRLKRDGKILDEQAINGFVSGLVDGNFSDSQVGAMAMAIFQQGMSIDERVNFTKAMMRSGEVLSWEGFDGPIVDKHSTGGVGDKVSFMLAAIVAACGGYVPMISGRGLGHTGGTADKLESIAGFNVQPSISEFKRIVKDVGVAIISQTDNLAPADKRLYSIRDVTATVESIPLITASILSKKLAAGLDVLVMDVKVGNGAMMNNLDDAKALAQSITSVANGAGVKTQAIITDMNQVLGTSAGNAIEMYETVKYLTGKQREPRLHKIVQALASAMLINTNLASSEKDAREKIDKVLNSGLAAEKFDRMVSALGGPKNFIEKPWDSMKKANVITEVRALQHGYIAQTDTRAIGMSVVGLGGGRTAPTQQVDHSVGFDRILPLGVQVNRGEVIARLHAKDEDSANRAIEQFNNAITYSEESPELPPVIY